MVHGKKLRYYSFQPIRNTKQEPKTQKISILYTAAAPKLKSHITNTGKQKYSGGPESSGPSGGARQFGWGRPPTAGSCRPMEKLPRELCAWLRRWAKVIPTDSQKRFQGLKRKAAGDWAWQNW